MSDITLSEAIDAIYASIMENNKDLDHLGFGPHDPSIYNMNVPPPKQP